MLKKPMHGEILMPAFKYVIDILYLIVKCLDKISCLKSSELKIEVSRRI